MGADVVTTLAAEAAGAWPTVVALTTDPRTVGDELPEPVEEIAGSGSVSGAVLIAANASSPAASANARAPRRSALRPGCRRRAITHPRVFPSG